MSEALRQVVWKCDRCGGDAQAIFGIFPSCKCGSTSFKAAQPPAPTAQPTSDDWKHLLPFGYAPGDYMMKCKGCAQTVSFVDKRALHCRPCAEKLHAAAQPVQQPGAEPDGRLHTDGYFTWKRRDGYVLDAKLPCDFYLAAPAQRQPLSDEQIDSLTFPFLTAELGPTAYDRAIARAVEAAHGITAAPAAQKGEKL